MQEIPSLLCRGLGLLRRRLFLLLLLFFFLLLLIVLWRATLGTSTGGNARALSRSLCRWLFLFRGSFRLWFGFLGASCFLTTVGLGLLFFFLLLFALLLLWFLLLRLLLGLLPAVLLYFGFFLRVGFGDGSAFAWLILGPCFIFVAATALFVLFRNLASLRERQRVSRTNFSRCYAARIQYRGTWWYVTLRRAMELYKQGLTFHPAI